jgi:hypothetical protein
MSTQNGRVTNPGTQRLEPPPPPSLTGTAPLNSPPSYEVPAIPVPRSSDDAEPAKARSASKNVAPASPRRAKSIPKPRRTFKLHINVSLLKAVLHSKKSATTRQTPNSKTIIPYRRDSSAKTNIFVGIVLAVVVLVLFRFGSAAIGWRSEANYDSGRLAYLQNEVNSLSAQNFPLDSAKLQASKLATECFTTYTYKGSTEHSRLADPAIGLNSPSCGWNGLGINSILGSPVYDPSQSTVEPDRGRAMIAMSVRTFPNAGYFTYIVPFVKVSNTAAKMVGQGSIFGPQTNPAGYVFDSCSAPNATDPNRLAHFKSAAQIFLNAPSDPNAPTAQGVNYNGLGNLISSPRILDVIECVAPYNSPRHLFRVNVQLTGPIDPSSGGTFTTWYAMSSITDINQRELIQAWGPDPLGGGS